MIEKRLDFPGIDPESGQIFVEAYDPNASGLTKTARTKKDYAPELQKYIQDIKKNPAYIYVIVSALGAGEYYSSNINGDYFEEAALLHPNSPTYGYKSFYNAGVYRHHQNKDIEKSFGKIVFVVYNHKMHRVELVIRIDKKKGREEGHDSLVSQLEAGENVAVSMGARVQFDICSKCGHKSRTRSDYCQCAKTELNKIHADGTKTFLYNPDPRFFDLSFVLIGADRTGFLMEKVASVKEATILKEVPGLGTNLNPLFEKEESLPEALLRRLADRPLGNALGALLGKGILLKPSEFQRIVIVQKVGDQEASRLFRGNRVFSPQTSGLGLSPIHKSFIGAPLPGDESSIMSARSMFCPHSFSRLEKLAFAQPAEIYEPLGGPEEELLGKLYFDYRTQALGLLGEVTSHGGLEKTAYPATMGALLKKVPAWALLIPLVYAYSAHLRGKEQKHMPLNLVERFIANHPVLTSSGMTAIGLNQKAIKNVFRGLS
jgi:hypothetical protein